MTSWLNAKEGANVLITCDWKGEELEKHLTPAFKKAAALKKIHLYTIDSTAIAQNWDWAAEPILF